MSRRLATVQRFMLVITLVAPAAAHAAGTADSVPADGDEGPRPGVAGSLTRVLPTAQGAAVGR